MEIASAINGIIERLHSKETELNNKIESDRNECNRLKKIIDELQIKVDALNTVITNSDAEFMPDFINHISNIASSRKCCNPEILSHFLVDP